MKEKNKSLHVSANCGGIARPASEMTCTVSSGELNPTQTKPNQARLTDLLSRFLVVLVDGLPKFQLKLETAAFFSSGSEC